MAFDVLEKHIEKYLREQIKKAGGRAYKFTSPGMRSVPDRVCVLPGGEVIFIECKRPGKKATPAQQREINRLRSMGAAAYVVDTKVAVDLVLGLHL